MGGKDQSAQDLRRALAERLQYQLVEYPSRWLVWAFGRFYLFVH